MGIDKILEQARSRFLRLDPEAAWVAAQEANTFLVDIRPEFQRRASGELPDAIVIERKHLEWRLDPSSDGRIPEAVDTGVRWIILCEAGYASTLAADSLRRIGLRRSTDVGGFRAWSACGLPVLGSAVTRPVCGPGEASYRIGRRWRQVRSSRVVRSEPAVMTHRL
jgi:rhodanese-related sulfurtransferase